MSVLQEKLKSAEAAVAAIEKQFGKGAIMKLGARVGIKHPCIPTGVFGLDKLVIQAGGIPKHRITEIYGPESGGKTTIALTVIAQAQKEGGLAAFIDAEHALDPTYAKALGVDVDNLLVSQPMSGEEALEITETLIRSGAFSVIVVDSVAALVPQAEMDGDMGDSHMGMQARLMSQACRKLAGLVNQSGTALVFINQIRDKIGVMFGSPETTTGGRALKFYASLRLDIRRISTAKEDEVAVRNRVRIKAVKNKVGSPFREIEVDLVFGKGLDVVGSYVDEAVEEGVVEKSGSWYSYKGERIGQGRENALQTFIDNQELYAQLKKEMDDLAETWLVAATEEPEQVKKKPGKPAQVEG